MKGDATSSSEDAPWVSAMVGGKVSKDDPMTGRAARQSLANGYSQWFLNQVPTVHGA